MKLKIIGTNQTELQLKNTTIFFSYETPVAAFYKGELIQTMRFYSRTTSKHSNAWLAGREARKVPQVVLDNLLKTLS